MVPLPCRSDVIWGLDSSSSVTQANWQNYVLPTVTSFISRQVSLRLKIHTFSTFSHPFDKIGFKFKFLSRSHLDSNRQNYARIGVLYYGQQGQAINYIGLTRYTSEAQKAQFQDEVRRTPFLNQQNTDVSGALATASQVHPKLRSTRFRSTVTK